MSWSDIRYTKISNYKIESNFSKCMQSHLHLFFNNVFQIAFYYKEVIVQNKVIKNEVVERKTFLPSLSYTYATSRVKSGW